MSRWLAGTFDPSGRDDGARLARALGTEATVVRCGPLRVAYSGPPAPAGEVLCLLDGHLDNAEELRRALGEPRGAPASEGPDRNPLAAATGEGDRASAIEPLLAAGYRRWGTALPERLRGDFALLLWDRARERGLLARDQLGVRPLFLHDGGGPLRFANEMRLLLALLAQRPAPDPAGVAHWIAVSTRPGTGTLYRGVRRLSPGVALAFEGDQMREVRYWRARFREPQALPPEQLAARLRESLELAVRRRIAPAGRTAILMSGGLDSSSVAALCAREAGERALACSATFPEHPLADEAPLIGELLDALRLPAIGAEVRPGGLLASALESLAAWQVPLLGWGDFWTLPLLRAARAEGAHAVLDGDGGDELFGPRADLLADRLRAGHPLRALEVARRLPGAAAGPSRREVARMFASLALGAVPPALHGRLQRPFARRELPSWLLPRAARDLVASDDPFAWKRLDGPRWWARAAHAVTQSIEETGVFEHQRRRAALAGLESRHPLLDLDLVELCLAQPPEATLDARFNRPTLRASMAGLLPDSVRLRPGKARFESLVVDSLAGPDSAAVRALLTDPGAELRAFVDLDGVQRSLLATPGALTPNPFRWMWQIWRLSTAECWLRAEAHPGGELAPAPSAARVEIRHSRPAPAPSYVFPP